jgi:hypothetical protein
VDRDINLYDTEVLAIEKMAEKLRTAVGTARNLEAFRREVSQRFDEIGLVARVAVYEQQTRQGPVYFPEITIVGRHAARSFDHDQMRHEVQRNVIGRPGHDDVAPLVVSVPQAAPSG